MMFDAVLSTFPKMEFCRAPRGLRPRLIRDPSWHDWREIDPGVAWRCAKCFLIEFGSQRPMLGCRGVSTSLHKLSGAEGRGHQLAVSMIDDENQTPLVCCYKCGAYASQRCVLLADACKSKLSKSGAQTLYRVKQGRHPHYHNDSLVADPCKPSARIVLEAAFASDAGGAASSRSHLISTPGILALAARIKAREEANATPPTF